MILTFSSFLQASCNPPVSEYFVIFPLLPSCFFRNRVLIVIISKTSFVNLTSFYPFNIQFQFQVLTPNYPEQSPQFSLSLSSCFLIFRLLNPTFPQYSHFISILFHAWFEYAFSAIIFHQFLFHTFHKNIII